MFNRTYLIHVSWKKMRESSQLIQFNLDINNEIVIEYDAMPAGTYAIANGYRIFLVRFPFYSKRKFIKIIKSYFRIIAIDFSWIELLENYLNQCIIGEKLSFNFKEEIKHNV